MTSMDCGEKNTTRFKYNNGHKSLAQCLAHSKRSVKTPVLLLLSLLLRAVVGPLLFILLHRMMSFVWGSVLEL